MKPFVNELDPPQPGPERQPLDPPLALACLRDPEQAGARLAAIAPRTEGSAIAEQQNRVAAILERVRLEGDAALIDLTEQFDGVRPDPLAIPPERLHQAWETTAPQAPRPHSDASTAETTLDHSALRFLKISGEVPSHISSSLRTEGQIGI